VKKFNEFNWDKIKNCLLSFGFSSTYRNKKNEFHFCLEQTDSEGEVYINPFKSYCQNSNIIKIEVYNLFGITRFINMRDGNLERRVGLIEQYILTVLNRDVPRFYRFLFILVLI